jgi:cytoskeletal protein CcmA (bactofilin family)
MKERPIAGPGTIIGANVVLSGILKDAGDIAVHGKVEGEISSERSIIIGETAEIKGPITGQIITVAGVVRGSIEATQKLELLPTGKVYGSISTRDLIVRSGAIFVGKSAMPVDESPVERETYDEDEAESGVYESVTQVMVDDEDA